MSVRDPMKFEDWRQLGPAAAARLIHARFHERLTPAQQRATMARLSTERELAGQFAITAYSNEPLACLPVLVKDLFDVAGSPTLAGSTFLETVRPSPHLDSALVVALRTAGAVIAGKTHTHEFAYGITGENPHYGDVEHPRFPGRTTGGSSSGSAAAVAAGIVPLAIGSDTGGSIRVPAAFCGLFGFRLAPRDKFIADAIPLAPSFDTAGWFTATADDMHDAIDGLIGLRRGDREPRGCYLEMEGVDPDVAQACGDAARRFAPPADSTTRAELRTGFAAALDSYHTTVAIEAWEFHREWAERFRDRYDPVVWQRLNRVHSLTAAQREAATRGLAEVRATWEKFFLHYDFLVLPAAPTGALTKAACTLENRNRLLALTAPASVGGRPVFTVPVPLSSGLTSGLQIVVKDPHSPAVRWALRRCGAG